MKLVSLVGLVLILCTPLSAQSYEVQLLAGSRSGGGHRDGVDARFSLPTFAAVDGEGNIFVADRGNHVIRRIAPGGSVSTVAGTPGEEGSADGPASVAKFRWPFAVAIDSSGNLFVSDYGNHAIRKIDAAGNVSTFAGLRGSPGTSDGSRSVARFTYPRGIAVDSNDGTIFVADSGNHAIRQISSTGSVSTLVGQKRNFGSADGFGNQAQFYYPFDVALDSFGDLYVTDTNNHTIRKITRAGRVTTFAGMPNEPGEADGFSSDARFEYPWGLDVAPGGAVFVADTRNQMIRRISPAAEVTTVAGSADTIGTRDGASSSATFHTPTDVVVESSGTLLIMDSENHCLRRISSESTSTFVGSKPTPGVVDAKGDRARFFYPEGISFDGAGNVWTVGAAQVIRRITPDGSVTTYAGAAGSVGSADGDRRSARFNYPSDIAITGSGEIVIVDTLNHAIRKIDLNGIASTLAGKKGVAGFVDGSGAQAEFDHPWGIAIDSRGVMFVADAYNHVIRTVEPTGIVTTFAGSPGSRGYRDAIGRDARFSYPLQIDFDEQDNLFVADWGNGLVRRITPSGVVTTLAGKAGEFGSNDGVGSAARFDEIYGIAAAPDGSIFISDRGSDTIRKLTRESGTWRVSTIAGRAYMSGNIDGNSGSSRFHLPEGIAVSVEGKIAVADTYNHAIRTMEAAPPSIEFSASKTLLKRGESTTLSWSVLSADTVTIDPGIGSVPHSGSRHISPERSTIYTLTAKGVGGEVEAQIYIRVGGRARAVSRP